ncbi:hypothetical protein D9M73_288040 [compost metagenome]
MPREDEEDQRSWLAKATLGFIESDAPPPEHVETQASRDVIRQYEDAVQQLPPELKQDAQADEPEEAPAEEDGQPRRSWWSRLTFGLFD